MFIFRLYQLQRFFFYGGSQYFQIWIGRLQVLRKRIIDAWMDTFQADPPDNLELLAALQAESAQTHADGLAMQQQAAQAGVPLVPIILFTI